MSKKANGGGSITKKVDKKGEKTYTYWRARWTDPDGQVKEKRFDSQAAAQAFLTKTLADIQRGAYTAPNNKTLGVWLDEWLEDFTADLKYQTKKSYAAALKEHIKPKLGKIKLEDLKGDKIQGFVNGLSKTGKKTVTKGEDGKERVSYSGLAPKSVKNIYGVLRAALETAVDMKLIQTNPADRVKLPRLEKTEKKYLSKTQLNDFMAAARQDSLGIALMILPLCGLRESELLGLTWDCVDFKKNRLHVNKQQVKRRASDGGYTLDSTKTTKSTRYVQLAPFAMNLLKEREMQQVQERFKAGENWQGFQSAEDRQKGLVFTNEKGTNVNPKVLWRHCKNVLSSIGIDDMTVHDLRHSFAVLSLEAGDDIKIVSGNLGHASTSFTLDVYGHVSDAMMKESAARMQALLDDITGKRA